MRTVKIRHVHVLTPTLTVEVETEEIIEDDSEAREAGATAYGVLVEAFNGMVESSDEADGNSP